MMNARVRVMRVCVSMNGTASTLKTNFYELAETTFLDFIFSHEFFILFSVVFELLIAKFEVFLS